MGVFTIYNVFEKVNIQEIFSNSFNQLWAYIQPYIINALIASAVICFLAFLVKRGSLFYFQLCGDSQTVANKKANKLSRKTNSLLSFLDSWNSLRTKK